MFTSKLSQETVDQYLEAFGDPDTDPELYVDEGQEDRWNPEIPPQMAARLLEIICGDEISRDELISRARVILESEV
jgi:hypothetical protein